MIKMCGKKPESPLYWMQTLNLLMIMDKRKEAEACENRKTS
jgi:hypothetical protein